ncbi:MAG: hypothetical protein ACT4PP_07775 [Sporichthyaceae bacterium]
MRALSSVRAEDGVPPLVADGSLLDVLMLQVHVAMAGAWLLTAFAVALLAVPRLRTIPSAAVITALAKRRDLLFNALWGSFVLTLSTGTYLLLEQTVYSPPVSGADWDLLERAPFGLPYYYALYAKIAIFLAMSVATLVLALEAHRGARPGHAEVSRRGQDPGAVCLDDDVTSEEVAAGPADPDPALAATRTGAGPRAGALVLWSSVAVLGAGTLAIGLCVTLVKYFHELARAAVVFQQLRGR